MVTQARLKELKTLCDNGGFTTPQLVHEATEAQLTALGMTSEEAQYMKLGSGNVMEAF